MVIQPEADLLSRVCALWDLDFRQSRTDLPLAGSPERCEFRTVIEDFNHNLYILENIAAETRSHKLKIADCLFYLSDQNLALVHPYLKQSDNETIALYQERLWQIGPFVVGVELARPDYVHEGWRGRNLAAFLLKLRDKSSEVPGFDSSQPFSILAFIDDFMLRLKKHDPQISTRVQPAYVYLQAELQPVHDQLPVSFCHGDLHPLNVIWSADKMLAVIDWEFLGYKTEAYDAANLVGCIGMEIPQGLIDDLVFEFILSLKNTAYLSKAGWRHFFEMVLALRFAWLSEWLHRNDPEMVELEMVYINMLLENRDLLLRSWGIDA